MKFTLIDSIFITLISIIALYARLYTIAHPTVVTFDEVHFGNFTKWYINKRFHFDIHPPLGKMLMAYISKASQYKGNIDSFNNIGTAFKTNETAYLSVRIIPAIFSSFVSPLLYTALRNFEVSPFTSFASVFLVAFDSSMITESKFILSDGMLHFFSALHIECFALFMRTQNNYHVVLAGITLGCASACKYTALGLIALDGLVQVAWILVKWPSIIDIILRAGLILVPTFFSFVTVWIFHFALTPYHGHNSNYIDQADRHTLMELDNPNTSYWGNRLTKSPLFLRIIKWNIVMNAINMRSNCPHPWSSSPEYWPLLMDKYVMFYSSGEYRQIMCFGLPVSYWFSAASIVLAIPFLFFKLSDYRNLIWILGWSVSFFPFLRVPRTMFHYHYLVPLMFATLNYGTLIEKSLENHLFMKSFVNLLTMASVFSCYLFFSPYIYGTPCPQCGNTRSWVKAWSNGPAPSFSYYNKPMYHTALLKGSLPL
ncbi:Dolichyl-phosphate-mannose-protein mannosyltransferase, putative [Trichomonas vaginalis G3]|uniref:Dolichyl-phosphate-mannose-protein mannosyltransferase, putative n=1 Tax=Trichomonas vaginalis (strain ATCC PRA-98 / G3) TaxID=412133 RepID=A2E5A0_TRIV3|nr:dolichyl-phosphate-mannose-protein mannosyltransferase protein [Trichomonas vaginalis G3]EAY12180.1 Dolichyl-phosphate-mannose-protein mannosyltransferase, putative [Trichomonas vaginalis G3]KAI5515433.1 dolichyl-phosphate-mannose-protein mannosyltransferase protein [Trichomonas vaginalis G3]|eukprot:XP_001324403.1 Dolichyl-phosphate-mannose-protein mannosyltransferase [Trichomonas vaginalis G3]